MIANTKLGLQVLGSLIISLDQGDDAGSPHLWWKSDEEDGGDGYQNLNVKL